MKKFERTEITIDVYGAVYKLNCPTFKQALDLGKKSEGKSDVETQEMMFDFLEERGLPRSVTSDMEINHVSDIMDIVMPSKKK